MDSEILQSILIRISLLSRDELKQEIKSFGGALKFDFTADYLDTVSYDRLRHILFASTMIAREKEESIGIALSELESLVVNREYTPRDKSADLPIARNLATLRGFSRLIFIQDEKMKGYRGRYQRIVEILKRAGFRYEEGFEQL